MFSLRGIWIVDSRTMELLFAYRFPTVEQRLERLTSMTSTLASTSLRASSSAPAFVPPSAYVPIPADDRALAMTVMKHYLAASPESLRSTVWLEAPALEAAEGGGATFGDAGQEDGSAPIGALGPFIFQRPTRDIVGAPFGCYSTSSLFIIGLPLISHLIKGAYATPSDFEGSGGFLDYPCITACQAILREYVAPFISNPCIARDPEVPLGLAAPLSRRHEVIEEQAAAIRQPDGRGSFFFGRNQDESGGALAGSDTTTDAPLVIVSSGAWERALTAFVSVYLPFGSSSYFPAPTVGLRGAIEKLTGGGSGVGSSISAGLHDDDEEANQSEKMPSVMEWILMMEDVTGDDAMTIQAHPSGRGSNQGPRGRDGPNLHAGSASLSNRAAGSTQYTGVSISVVEDVSCRIFGPTIPSRSSVITSVYAQRPTAEQVALWHAGSSTPVATPSAAAAASVIPVTFVVLGLSTQAATLLTSPEVVHVHHRVEPLNTKQRLFASNSEAISTVARHARPLVESTPLRIDSGDRGSVLSSSTGGLGGGNASPNRGASPGATGKDAKAIEATFIQAAVGPSEDDAHVRLLQIPSVNNTKLAPVERDIHEQGQRERWRQSAHGNVFVGTFEVLPILSRPTDQRNLNDLRASQILVQFKLDIELDLSPCIPHFPTDLQSQAAQESSNADELEEDEEGEGAEEEAPRGGATGTTIVKGDAPYPKATMEWMSVKIDFHNKATIVPDTIEVTSAQPLGPPTVRACTASSLEWSLPRKAVRKHGTRFLLVGSCVINSPIERAVTQVPAPLSDTSQLSSVENGPKALSTITTVEYGDVPAVTLEGPLAKEEGFGLGPSSSLPRQYRVNHKCWIPLASCTIDFEMSIPEHSSFLLPCDILDTNSFADAVGTVDAKSNPFSAGSIKGGCIVANSLVVRSCSLTLTGEPLSFETEGRPGCGINSSTTPATRLAPANQNLSGYILWNRLNDGGFHLPHSDE